LLLLLKANVLITVCTAALQVRGELTQGVWSWACPG